MSRERFDAADGLTLLGELARLTAGTADAEKVSADSLALVARTLHAVGAILLGQTGEVSRVVASWGQSGELQAAATRGAIPLLGSALEETTTDDGVGRRVIVPLEIDETRLGAIVIDRPESWNDHARQFAGDAARAIAASLGAVRRLDDLRRQGERLERRNLELEILSALSRRLRDEHDDNGALQAALGLVLDKLELAAGWIFWDADNRGHLDLAAARGVSETFLCRAREEGIGDCLCKDVFATGLRMQARNTIECPRLPDLVGGSQPMVHACIPLKFARGILGVLNLAGRPGQLFSPDELQFLETVARHICMAVDRAQASRSEARRNAEARALVSLTRAIGGSLDLDTVLAAAGHYARELLEVDRCAIFLGESAEALRFAFLSGRPMDGLTVGEPADLRAVGSKAPFEALRRRRTLVTQDALNDPLCDPEAARRWEVGSAILVPLVGHEVLEGLLIATRTRPGEWKEEAVDLADALAGQVALAIENARLYRQAQGALLKLQEAQYSMMRSERLAAAGTLASSLAHEVRNPLNAINLQLILLGRRLGRVEGPLREEVAALLESSRHEIARLDQLVEEFLSLSSIDRVRLEIDHPEAVAREVLSLMAPVAKERGVQMRDELAGGLPALPLDREKIKQVLMNLVRNAIDAMPGGGTLTLGSEMVDGSPVLRVADTGVGIEPGLDVFDLFLTTKHGGTGLGLPIARRIIEAHGGSLTYESGPGKGTVFNVAFKPSARKRSGSKEDVSP
jgi:signal transduction histidine kinase